MKKKERRQRGTRSSDEKLKKTKGRLSEKRSSKRKRTKRGREEKQLVDLSCD